MYRRLKDEKYYNKVYFEDSFHAQCVDVDPLTMEQFERSVVAAQEIAELPTLLNCTHIIGVGCGDSNIAAFAVKEAFSYYLPDVIYEGVEAIEMSRHWDYPADGKDYLALNISYSGGVIRGIEAARQCQKHGIPVVAVTAMADSELAKICDILYHTNNPPGDNNAGLRTYYSNVISCIVLAAAMAEARTGQHFISKLRRAVQTYHDAFFTSFTEIDKFCFYAAIHFMDKSIIEVTADGHNFWAGKFIQAKILELSGDACSVIDSENYMHVNSQMHPGRNILEIVLVNTNDNNVRNIVNSTNAMVERCGRDVIVFSDKSPEELGITVPVHYCYVPVPEKDWNFLAPLYAYLPGALFAGYRHTTLGEPMFRGGMDSSVFPATYCSPLDVVELP